MAAKPVAELLGDGDILVPVEGEDGGWRMARIAPADKEYAEWLTLVQRRGRPSALDFWTSGMVIWIALPLVTVVLFVAVLLLIHALNRRSTVARSRGGAAPSVEAPRRRAQHWVSS